MTWSNTYKNWFVKNSRLEETLDEKKVEVWKFLHTLDSAVLSPLAEKFRREYCFDEEIDTLREASFHSTNEELLKHDIFPNAKNIWGPSRRSGDFGEFLVANFLEFVKGYWIPHHRFIKVDIPEKSTGGCDVIGFRISELGRWADEDTMVICEVKTNLTENTVETLKEAVKDSAKDPIKIGASLNAIKRRLTYKHKITGRNDESDFFEKVKIVKRFQKEADINFSTIYIAVAVIDNSVYDVGCITFTDASSHPKYNKLNLMVFTGDELLKFLNSLYERAANETRTPI